MRVAALGWKFPKSDDFQEMAGGPILSGSEREREREPLPPAAEKDER